MTTVIIEDNAAAKNILKTYISKFCPSLNLVGEAENITEGFELINQVQPSLVFLDIEMPDGTGFDLLRRLPNPDFRVIFTTAHEKYALQAIKFSALDYLLKPIDLEDLLEAVTKVYQLKEKEDTNLKIKTLLQNLEQTQNQPKILIVKDKYGAHLINIEDIFRLEAMGSYTKLYILNQNPIVASKTLGEYDNLLPKKTFFRCHQSHLINLNHLLRYDRREGNMLILKDGTRVPLSTRKKDILLEKLQGK